MNPPDHNFFALPTNISEYQVRERDMVENFTPDECYKICRTLDILHSTYRKAMKSKLNAGQASGQLGQAQMKQINLFNYLGSLDPTLPLYSALFEEREGNVEGLLLFTPSEGGGRSILSQVVDPKITQEQVKAREKAHKRSRTAAVNARHSLHPEANHWIKKDDPSIKDYLDGNTPGIIIDKLAKSNDEALKFSSRYGDVEIKVGDAGQQLLLPGLRFVHTNPYDKNSIMFGLEPGLGWFFSGRTPDLKNFTQIIRYLPYYQAWERKMEGADLTQFKKPANMIPKDSPKRKGITPMILQAGEGCNDDKKKWRAPSPLLFCVLCGCELEKDDKGCYIMDIDHTQNLIVNSAFGLNNSVHGFFNTCASCNRNFKKAKIFTPNLGVWRLLRARGGENPNDFNEYPGRKFGMFGVGGKYNETMPAYGWRVFNIGYRMEEFRKHDWAAASTMDGGDEFNNFATAAAAATSSGSSSGSSRLAKEMDDLKESEGLNNKHIREKRTRCHFNEFDLQLKFLKRILHIAEKIEEEGVTSSSSNDVTSSSSSSNDVTSSSSTSNDIVSTSGKFFFSHHQDTQKKREDDLKNKMLNHFHATIMLMIQTTLSGQQLSQSQQSTPDTDEYTQHIRETAEKIFTKYLDDGEITEIQKNKILRLVADKAHELAGADIVGTIKVLNGMHIVYKTGSTEPTAFITSDFSETNGLARLMKIDDINQIEHGALRVLTNSIDGLVSVLITVYNENTNELPGSFVTILPELIELLGKLKEMSNKKNTKAKLNAIFKRVKDVATSVVQTLNADESTLLSNIGEDLEETEVEESEISLTQLVAQTPSPQKRQSSSSSSSSNPSNSSSSNPAKRSSNFVVAFVSGSKSNKMAKKNKSSTTTTTTSSDEDTNMDGICNCGFGWDSKQCICHNGGRKKRKKKRTRKKKKSRTKRKNLKKGTKRKTRKKYRKKNYSSKSSS